jgi:hypothetical protein
MSRFRHASRILILRPHPWTLRAMLVEGGSRSDSGSTGPAAAAAGEASPLPESQPAAGGLGPGPPPSA